MKREQRAMHLSKSLTNQFLLDEKRANQNRKQKQSKREQEKILQSKHSARNVIAARELSVFVERINCLK